MENRGSPLDKNAKELTVMDVYDIAAILGHEFERIIDQYGCEALLRLMPKVVRILEVLEALVSRSTANPETEELRRELDRLRQERNDRYEKEKKHQRELELVEDVWRGETQDLLSKISLLQAENRRLQTNLSIKDLSTTEEASQKPEGIPEQQQQAMKKLKEMVDKQKDELRAKDQELTLRNEDIEALQMQQYRLIKINQGLRHRVGALEAQGKTLIQHKAELEAAAQARQQELTRLREGSWERQRETERTPAEREECSPSKARLSPSATAPQTASLVGAEMDAVKHSSMWVECRGDTGFLADCFESEKRSDEDGDEDEDMGALLLQDTTPDGEPEVETVSDKPRFTLQELCDVLQEKNDLKAQVFMLHEELAYYKSEEFEDVGTSVTVTTSPSPAPLPADQPESRIRRLIFTAIMPMVAAGLIQDDPTLLPIRRLVSFV